MAAVAVQSIADDVTRWITTPSANCTVPKPSQLRRYSSRSAYAHVFVSYAAHADADFARAVVARLRLERPHLRVAVETEDERLSAAAAAAVAPQASLGVQARQSGASTSAGLILVALTRETFDCPLVQQEIAVCLSYARQDASESDDVRIPRLAFVYNVRNGRGQDPSELIRNRAPAWLQVGMQSLGSDTPGSLLRVSAAVPIFEYLHEYDDLCVSAVLKWLDSHDTADSSPNSTTLQRLHSSLRSAANILRSPAKESQKSLPEDPPPRTLPPVTPRKGSSVGAIGSDFMLNASRVKAAPRSVKVIAVGLLYDPKGPGDVIARDVAYACGCTFGTTVRTAEVGGQNGAPLETVANLMVIVTPGAFRCEVIVQVLTKALRTGGVNILLLQDVRTVPNIWDEFETLPAALRPGIVSIIAVPYLQSHGFSACLARLAGTELLRPVGCAEGPLAKPAAAEYGRSRTQKIFDLFLCHFQRTGLDWAFAMRLGFVQHAGIGFRTFLDVQSLQNVNECGRFVEQSHAIAVLITRGIFTRAFCQRELLFARRAGVQIIFIQHMRSCIDIDEELNLVRMEPSEFMVSEYGMEYSRAGGTEASFEKFQQVLFQQIWTQKFRPPVFAYIHELESACVHEIVGYLRNRRARRNSGIEQLDQAARALLDFLRMSLDDRGDVRSGLAALANQAAAGNGDEFCAAVVRVNALPAVSESLHRHGTRDSGVAFQALRALRTSAATSAGQAALLQFANTDGALGTLHEAITCHAEIKHESNEKLRREALAVLRSLRDGDAKVQLAVKSSGLHKEFEDLFHRLRAELEPLDAIREQLNLAPVQLMKLEFALGHWHKAQVQAQPQTRENASLPSEVSYANELLCSVKELREAVATGDGERADAILREHVKDVERCAGVEALLREAWRIANEFQEGLRARQEELRSEEARAKACRDARELLDELVLRAAEAPTVTLITELEDAIVSGHELRCPQGILEQAKAVLGELRAIFERPSEFLAAPEKHLTHIKPFAAVLALMAHNSQDRFMVLHCLESQAKQVEEEDEASPSLVKRSDVDKVLSIIAKYAGDDQMQVVAFECLTTLLRVTRMRHGAISARALIQHPTSGDFAAVQVAVTALSLQREGAKAQKVSGLNADVLGAACRSLSEMARLGHQVAAFFKFIQGLAQLWYVIRELGQEGRQRHSDTVVAAAVETIEEICRYGGREHGFGALRTLLKLCDIYDSEVVVCVPALRSMCSLFSEKPEWTGGLVGTIIDIMEDPSSPTHRKPGTVDEDGLGVVLRDLRMHEREAAVQRLGYTIIGTTVQRLLVDGTDHRVLPSYMWCKAVQMAIVALRVHLPTANTCESVLVSLSSLVDLLPDLVCHEVVSSDGVAPTVLAMDKHTKVGPIQQCGLKLMSRVTKRFPRQTLGEQNLRAIVAAMRGRPEDSLTQFFGCAALRSISEQGRDAVESVARLAADALFGALRACPGNVPLHGEAFRVIELVAQARHELGRMMGEKYQAVLCILNSIPALLSKPDSPQDIDTTTNVEGGLIIDVCISACSTLRALCKARAASGISYDRLFHSGICSSGEILADLLTAFPRSRDLQFEALNVLHEAVAPDADGAKAVGEMFARRGASEDSERTSNLLMSALTLFHTDSDCIVIFGLLSQLCVCEKFVASFMAASGSMAEVLRWAAIYRDDRLVQAKAVECIDALLKSSVFEPDLLIQNEGLEGLLLAAARHDGEVGRSARRAIVDLARRINPAVFYQALKACLQRHESNGKVIGATCSTLVAVFRADNQGFRTMRESGAMDALLKGVLYHREDRNVMRKFPPVVELSLQDSAMRKLFLKRGVQDLLMDVLQENFQAGDRRDDNPDWLTAVNGAARRGERTVDSLDLMAAGFRALQRLFCMERWRTVVNPELIELLMRTLAITDDHPLMTDAIAILKKALQVSEEQITWIACTGMSSRSEAEQRGTVSKQQLASLGRLAVDAEMRGIAEWRAGNFLPAAADFRAAKAAYEQLGRLTSNAPAELVRAFSEHEKQMPLELFARKCQEQHALVETATAGARMVQDMSPQLHTEDCPICFEKLAPAARQGSGLRGNYDAPLDIWQCDQCKQCMHRSCIVQWGQRSQTCPLCRVDVRNQSQNADAYHRARAVAQAAESRCDSFVSADSRTARCFLASSIAHLWRVAARLGITLGVDNTATEQDENHAVALEMDAQEACSRVRAVSVAFEKNFVQPCEVQATEYVASDLEITSDVLEAMAQEVLQRRCATLAEEAFLWESDVTRLQEQRRYDHCEQLVQLAIAQLSEVASLVSQAHLSETLLRKHIDDLVNLRREYQELRGRSGAVASTGDVMARRPQRPPLTPFGACLARSWDFSALSLQALAGVRAIAAAARASRIVASRDVRESSKVVVLTRRISAACEQLVQAILQDRLLTNIAGYMSGGSQRRQHTLLSISFFQQFQHCGPEARTACFMNLDQIISSLASPRIHQDEQIKACMCSLVHDLIFGGGNEERMVHRLQREASPRIAWSLEEWFLDTLLVQNNAQAFRAEILQPSNADAWFCCNRLGASSGDEDILGNHSH